VMQGMGRDSDGTPRASTSGTGSGTPAGDVPTQ